jgi:putative transposon-encoded protein
VAIISDTYMTLIKKKITEIESIVNKADKRKTAGKIYLPKDWIGKKVKTTLLSSIVVAITITNHMATSGVSKTVCC